MIASRLVFLGVLLAPGLALATEYHVASTGNDNNAGTEQSPFLTIQKAASTLQPGDICTVHAGTYREWVNPARGGSSGSPIVYRAAQGDQVYIKGSEQITSWTQDGSAWKTVIPNSTFGSFNPYSTNFSGDYLIYGSQYHLGSVYWNGTPYLEVLSQDDVNSKPNTWFAQVDANNTTIWANFGSDNPTQGGLAEVTERKYVFAPSTSGLGYITVDGFNISHGAPNWAPPTATPQEGMIMTNWGLAWTIQNNHITDGKTLCIAIGVGTSGGNGSINKVGNHIIRNNVIQRCGEAGIAGSHGAVASTITGNLIEEINPDMEFGGYETAGIKIHTAIDVLIQNNVIRKVHATQGPAAGQMGIWFDYQAQGSRITGNVLYDIDQSAIDFEADHGPTLVDNNVIVGNDNYGTFTDDSEDSIFVHNLLVDASWMIMTSDSRTPEYWVPHTTQGAGSAAIAARDNRYYNNVFVQKGPSAIPQETGYQCDYNVIYGATDKTSWGDAHSIVDGGFDAAFSATTQDTGVALSWKTNSDPTNVACPLITHDFIGVSSLTNQGIENHDGSPITIDHDMLGNVRNSTHPTAGPIETLSATNSVTIIAGSGAPVPSTGGTSGGGNGGSSSSNGGAANATGGAGSGASGNGGTSGSAGAGSGAGGTGSGAGGAPSGSSGATGSSGRTGSSGASGSAGNAGSGGELLPDGGTASPSEGSSSGSGCAVGASRRTSPTTAVAMLALALVSVRRRRRAHSR